MHKGYHHSASNYCRNGNDDRKSQGLKGYASCTYISYPRADFHCQPFTAFTDGLPIVVRKNAMEQLDIIQRLLKLHYDIDSRQDILDESENYYLVKIART